MKNKNGKRNFTSPKSLRPSAAITRCASIEPLENRTLMSVNLQLTANATGDNFTIVESGSVVNVYYNQPETGTPQSTTAVSDLSSITINGVGADTVTIDNSGGNPLPSAVTVASGAVTFNQDLGTGGTAVGVTVAPGAAANFSVTQHLNSLTVAAGASVNTAGTATVVLNTDTLTLNGAVNLGADALVVATPNASDIAIVGATTDANSGVYTPDDVVTTTVQGTVDLVEDNDLTYSLGDGAVLTDGNLVAVPITGVVTATDVGNTVVGPGTGATYNASNNTLTLSASQIAAAAGNGAPSTTVTVTIAGSNAGDNATVAVVPGTNKGACPVSGNSSSATVGANNELLSKVVDES